MYLIIHAHNKRVAKLIDSKVNSSKTKFVKTFKINQFFDCKLSRIVFVCVIKYNIY